MFKAKLLLVFLPCLLVIEIGILSLNCSVAAATISNIRNGYLYYYDCIPTCNGIECGNDGCLGSCGECGNGKICVEGKCENEYPLSCFGYSRPSAKTCSGYTTVGCCDNNNYYVFCKNDMLFCANCPFQESPDNTCGWAGTGYGCGGTGVDPKGQYPLSCGLCIPNCDGKECGLDGCGGECPDCDTGKICYQDKCVNEYPEACFGIELPSALSCTFGNVSGVGCCDDKGRLIHCSTDGKLFCEDCSHNPTPGNVCGWENIEIGYFCGGSGEDPDLIYPRTCGTGCVAYCLQRECGDDGCGGKCGSCDDDNECTDDSCMDGFYCAHDPSKRAGLPCVISMDAKGVCDESGKCISQSDYCNTYGCFTPDGGSNTEGDSTKNESNAPSDGCSCSAISLELSNKTL